MFKKQLALERAQGYRGVATRLIGPILDVREADLVIRETCFTLVGIAALFAVGSFKFGIAFLVFAGMIGLPALLTAFSKSRVATITLDSCVLLSGAIDMLFGGSNTRRLLFYVLLALFAARASEAIFKRRRLLRAVPVPPVSFSPPGSTAV